MKGPAFAAEMPLLAKELIEQAARRRTYVVRFVYAATLFVIALFLFYGSAWGNPEAGNLGQGRYMFEQLVVLQFWAISLFVPALVSGVITIEKEQDSLSLLLLTTLTPESILFQKLAGRLVPVLSFLLLSFPLMAVAYSFGGVSDTHLWSGITLSVASTVQIGVLSLMCSAYFPTTAGAFVASYLCVVLVRMTVMFDGLEWFLTVTQRDGSTWVGLLMILLSCLVAFGIARASLVRRAFVAPRNAVLQVFHYLDGVANEANEITGGVVLFEDQNLLPEDQAIAWRETAKKPLGTARYLFRVLTILELPILATCQIIQGKSRSAADSVSVLLFVLWAVSAVLVAVHAAGLLSSERTRQTLDVLLTIPMTGRQIILEKFQGVRRLMIVLLVPFATIFWFQDWWRGLSTYYYWFCSALTVAIFLPLVAWFSLWVGLKIRSQRRAILTSLSVISVWAIVPLAMQYGLGRLLGDSVLRASSYVFALSPSLVIPAVERVGINRAISPSMTELAQYAVSFAVHAGLLFFFRAQCLRRADTLLGRVPTTADPEVSDHSPQSGSILDRKRVVAE